MTLANMTQRASQWLRGTGPMHDVVISSRCRLARNLVGLPFLSRCTDEQKAEIVENLKQHAMDPTIAGGTFFVDVAAAGDLDRQLLVERHLISRQHARADYPRGAIVSENETVSMMINEEDHLRMQVLRSGMQLNEAFDQINRLDETLQERLDFAFSNRWGFLTACPTNVGTGLRVSVMLHLPGLKLTGELEKALRAARDMRLAIRGLYGEGTEATGDFFQVSNQVTLGRSEEQIVEEFLNVIVPELLRYERTARQALLKHNRVDVADKVYRALAVLSAARTIRAEEAMFLLSMVRLGVATEQVRGIDFKTVNELFLLAQPGHLQKLHGKTLDEKQRAEVRATLIRQRLGGG